MTWFSSGALHRILEWLSQTVSAVIYRNLSSFTTWNDLNRTWCLEQRHRLSYADVQLGILCLWFCCLTNYVTSLCICAKYICSNFNIHVLQKNGFCCFVSDQDKKTSFVAWNIQGNFFLHISVNQGNQAETFLKIAIYLSFPYLIPYKI